MAVSIASPLMPPVESPRVMSEAKDSEAPNEADAHSEKTTNSDVPNACDEKPTNGGGDAPSDDADDDSRKLFVGGLSWETTENDLKEYFSRWGKVTQCIIKLDRFTGNSRGFGFVTMENEECVSKVLSVSEHWLKNKKIDPKKAKPSREPLRKVFVGGIDPDVTEEQIREYFSTFGKVESLDLPFDTQKGKRKHYIFVSFATEAAARKAIAKERQEIFGRQCDVRVAVTREQANRQKALRQWYNWFDPAYGLPSIPYPDFANAYSGFDPFAYNYYGFDYYGNAAAAAAAATGYGAYQGITSNQFRGLTGGTKPAQCQRNSTGAIGGVNSNRLMATGTAPGSLSNHHPQQNQSHTALNFNILNPQLDHHPPSLSTGLDFSTPHPTQTGPGMVAGAAAGYPHP
ncbi:unnamed protein product [Calicophoron daubneyi]|uniref:RRM domain-containing protein n=1 Tax=Calicophoron daubneyi TaxID=300641 RepID=A0AAV2TTW9_CALDB